MMRAQCVSIRSRGNPTDRCPNVAVAGGEWCGVHRSGKYRWVATPGATTPGVATPGATTPGVATPGATTPVATTPVATTLGATPAASVAPVSVSISVSRIARAWRTWLARRAGPLLWFRSESNNPADFFSGDLVEELPLSDVISFVDSTGKGYMMDIKSAKSLLEHATAHKETPLNPFNRAPLPALFLTRVKRHLGAVEWQTLQPQTEEQRYSLACTDMFRLIEDLGYYTDPSWLIGLSQLQMQRLYIELADIWYHRAMLSSADRQRISPGQPFGLCVQASLMMPMRALRFLLIETCRRLVSAAPNRADRQTGVMYVLGALALVSSGCATAYPWLVEMFAPGVARIIGNQLAVLHAVVLTY